MDASHRLESVHSEFRKKTKQTFCFRQIVTFFSTERHVHYTHIETFFIEIKILATVDSGPKIHTRMPRAFERAPT